MAFTSYLPQPRGKFTFHGLHFLLLLVLVWLVGHLKEFAITNRKLGNDQPKIIGSVSNSSLREEESIGLDVIIAGFPKCGTTTLLHSFLQHNETMIAPVEFCGLEHDSQPEERIRELNKVLAKMPNPNTSGLSVQRGIKCPGTITGARGIELISSTFKQAKIIVGLRHPVSFFQSFYNYRVTEMYNILRRENPELPPDALSIENPPSPLDLVGSNAWKGVSTDLARYELGLMQLGKTPLSSADLSDLGSHGKRLSPTRLKIFLFSMEQLSDPNEVRASEFRSDLQRFLRLESPFDPFPHANTNRVRSKESIDICDVSFIELRKLLTKQGKITAQWIRDQLLKSEDIIVGSRAYFISLIETWGDDPCLNNGNHTNLGHENNHTVPKSVVNRNDTFYDGMLNDTLGKRAI